MNRFRAKKLSRDERAELQEAIHIALERNDLSTGQALRLLRAEYLGKSREGFAAMVGLSTSALSALELDNANPTVQTLNQAFRPFGYRVGLVPTHRGKGSLLVEALSEERYQALICDIQRILEKRPRGH